MGERFGDYELIRQIATGGMAEIHLARQVGFEGTSRHVVVKRMLPQLAVRPDFVQMFLDEARLANNLKHPNIVQVFDLGETNQSYYIAMEFIDGPHLGALFAHSLRLRKPLPIDLCAHVVARAADGLHFAHEVDDQATGRPLSVVHRDISPQNILVSRHGDVKVTDFGVAKASTQQTKTRTGIIKGKVAYMSPEQCLGDHIDRRTDIFALGIVLYELLTRRRLFRDKSDLLVMQKITQEDVPAPSTVNPLVDAELDSICRLALARDRDRRYATAADLSEALDGWLAARGHGDSRHDLERWFTQNAAELTQSTPSDDGTPAPASQPSWATLGKGSVNATSNGALSSLEATGPMAPVPDDPTSATPSLRSRESALEAALGADEDGNAERETAIRAGLPTASGELAAGPHALDRPVDSGERTQSQPTARGARTAVDGGGPDVDATARLPRGLHAPSGESTLPANVAPGRDDARGAGVVDSGAVEAAPRAAPRRFPLAALAGGAVALLLAAVVIGVNRAGADAVADEAVTSDDDAAANGPDVAVPSGGGDDANKPTAPSEGVQVTVETVPAGVPIMVDDERLVGKSPVTFAHAPGALRVQAMFNDQPPVSVEAELSAKEETVRVLAKVPLIVRTKPVARAVIKVDGAERGSSPIEGGVLVTPDRPVKVRAEVGGYRAAEVTMTPKAGEPLLVELTLEKANAVPAPPKPPPVVEAPEFGMLSVRVQGGWAIAKFNGETLGETDFTDKKVKAGAGRLTLTNKELGLNESLPVQVQKEKTTVVIVSVEKKGAGYALKRVR